MSHGSNLRKARRSCFWDLSSFPGLEFSQCPWIVKPVIYPKATTNEISFGTHDAGGLTLGFASFIFKTGLGQVLDSFLQFLPFG